MKTHAELVEHLTTVGVLKTPVIIEAFRAIDRIHFVGPEMAGQAYADRALPIGLGQTISPAVYSGLPAGAAPAKAGA